MRPEDMPVKVPCPICTTEADTRRHLTPYWICQNCACWFQSPMTPKVYIGAHEPPGDQMSDGEKAINDALAAHLLETVLANRFFEDDDGLTAHLATTLDIGAKYPYLASRLAARGCDAVAIDGDPAISVYAKALDVRGIVADFETMPIPAQRDLFDLVTLIHCFEHFYEPLAALRKLRLLVADDGRVFIRLPDHSVRGFERDLIPSHYIIHPFFYSFSSILEALARIGDCFVVESVRHMDGAGQSDIVLKPIKRRQSLAVGIITKNEERDIPRALASLAPLDAQTFVVDTGSTDQTASIARGWGAVVREYTDASIQDASGEWLLQDFAAARNEAIADAETKSDATHYMWFDADDELLSPDVVRRLLYWHELDCFGAMCEQAGDSWTHYRLWRLGKGIRFAGRIHEYAVLDGLATLPVQEFRIRHDATPSPTGEDANARNLRILQIDFAENPTTRGAFYLGGTHRDGGRHELAADWFRKRIEMGVGYRDEMLFAYLYAARAYRNLERWDDAESMAAAGAAIEPWWAEFRMERSMVAYKRGDYAQAIDFAASAINMPIPPTQLWREVPMYTDQPLRMLSWCHEHLGNMAQALVWAREAKTRINGEDSDWNARIARLESLQPTDAPAVHAPHAGRPIIGLCRPGAIGDILMTLNLIPALREANPDHDIAYFCDRRLGAMDALGSTMHAAGVDMIMDYAGWDRWRGGFDRAINLVGYPLAEGYPETPMRRHLLEYFAEEMGFSMPDPFAQLGLPALTLRRPIQDRLHQSSKYATLQIAAGWSKYKEWQQDKWNAIRDVLENDMNVTTVLINDARGWTLSQSIAVFANARMHIGIDSFCNHLTNYLWEYPGGGRKVRGVILWGSTQASAAGYATNTNITRALTCQPCFRENPAISRMDRGPCINPPRPTYEDETPWKCMAEISVDEVVDAVRKMWEESK